MGLSSRIGFCGEYNKEILSKMGDEFKKIFAKQIEAEYKGKSVQTTEERATAPRSVVCNIPGCTNFRACISSPILKNRQ